MEQILWIGCLESEEEFRHKAAKGYNLASAQVSQQNLLNGIEQISGLVSDSINGSVLPPYPIYKDRIIQQVEWSHTGNAFDISVGYRNYKYINRITCKRAMLKEAERWVKNRYFGGELNVIVYSMRSAPMATACKIKQLVPEAKLFLIITDLPQYMDLGESRVKALLKKFDWYSIDRMKEIFDGFILYASEMAKFLKIPDSKWILMEGSYTEIEEDTEPIEKHQNKVVMYSGKLDKQYGIKLLLDSFMSIQDADIELWLTGGGNAEQYIKYCAEKDSRIKFYGFLPSRRDVLLLQKKASVLINMRLPSEEASRYCFPSKLFEYMATGIPVLSFRLAGIPSDYYEYMYLFEEENEKSIAKTLKYVLNISSDERIALGRRAREYIVKNKNELKQCKKIITFIERIKVCEKNA